jgi:hypothetical protein
MNGLPTWLGVALLAAAACSTPARHEPVSQLGAAEESTLAADIAAGYAAYARTLDRWGDWSADPVYAVRWCPRDADASTFMPYRTNGHWDARPDTTAPSQTWSQPATAPYWLSDDSETWGEITMHHGWWVYLDDSGPSGLWCWIPGARETAGRVAWRESTSFVGWAPEPPSYDEDDQGRGLAWTYVLLGSLFERPLEDAVLTGEAAVVAASVSTFARRGGPSVWGEPRSGGPSGESVVAARDALSEYLLAHPVVSAQPEVTDSRRDERATSRPGLPPGMAIYEQLLHEPPSLTPGGALAPHLPTWVSSVRATLAANGTRPTTPAPSQSHPPQPSAFAPHPSTFANHGNGLRSDKTDKPHSP